MLSELFHSTDFWYAISFVFFVAIAFKAGKKAILNKLDNRIHTIEKELTRAENLRIEAQELLAQYQRKKQDALSEAEGILKNAETTVLQLQKKAEADLQNQIERRETQLQDRLNAMEEAALSEIRNYAANLTVQATKDLLATRLDKKTHSKLIDDSLDKLEKAV